MKARPILFSAPMVRALLAGTKTQTRRTVKWPGHAEPDGVEAHEELSGEFAPWLNGERLHTIECPYGAPGDLLWVREAFTRVPATAYRMSEGVQQAVNPDDRDEAAIYAAGWDRSIPKWKPSIHMPRWASRLTLEITDVRVERLQAISVADADAECFGGGFPWRALPELFPEPYERWGELSIPECYARLWEHINGPGSWDANPWVWAVSFKVHPANVADVQKGLVA